MENFIFTFNCYIYFLILNFCLRDVYLIAKKGEIFQLILS